MKSREGYCRTVPCMLQMQSIDYVFQTWKDVKAQFNPRNKRLLMASQARSETKRLVLFLGDIARSCSSLVHLLSFSLKDLAFCFLVFATSISFLFSLYVLFRTMVSIWFSLKGIVEIWVFEIFLDK